ncbi:manganese efflux pump [Candidatus Peregrinibacteria bacterium]|nr:MAG: manganese efflux pump [Candidatus Peregrinibacteria bacterium]
MNVVFLTALGLSMDACAASIALSSKYRSFPKLFFAAISFAVFQMVMPAFGYLLGMPFEGWIAPVDHWIAFFVLSGLGVNMIFDLKKEHEIEEKSGPLSFGTIGVLALATSIDALVVGVGFHALDLDFMSSILMIGVVTLLMSFLGLCLSRVFQKTLSSYAEKLGGIILIFLGIKILVTHLLGY